MEIAEATGYGSGLWKRVDQSGSEIKVISKAIIKQWKHRKGHKYDLKKKGVKTKGYLYWSGDHKHKVLNSRHQGN